MANVYNRAKLRMANTGLQGQTLQAILLTSGYTYDTDHNVVADLTPGSNELTVGGYARVTPLTGFTAAQDDSNDRAEIDLAQIAFPSLSSGETIAHLVIAIDSGNDAVDELVARYAITPLATSGQSVEFRFNGTDPGTALRLND